MPPPPSYLDIASVPYSRVVTQAEFNGGTFGGTANKVWFRFVTSIKVALGGFCNSGGSFTPRTKLYASDGTTLIKNIGGSTGWYHVVAAGTYYIEITRSAGGASNFDFTAQFNTAPVDGDVSFDPGDILINDDSGGNPVAAVFTIGGTVKGFIDNFPTGENGYILSTGESLWHDVANIKGGGFGSFALYDDTLAYVGSTALTLSEKSLVAASDDDFYVVEQSSGDVYRVGLDLTTTLLGTLPFTGSISAIGVSADGSTIYYTETQGDAGIHRWNLNTTTPMTDLYTIPGYDTVNDILAQTEAGNPGDIAVMSDGSIVTYWVDVSLGEYKIIHISSAGTLLHSYAQGTDRPDHLVPGGSATELYLWAYTDASMSAAKYGTFDLTTGTFDFFTTVLMSVGENLVSGDDTMFAPSTSCTFMRLGVAGSGGGGGGGGGDDELPDGIIGPLAWVHVVTREEEEAT